MHLLLPLPFPLYNSPIITHCGFLANEHLLVALLSLFIELSHTLYNQHINDYQLLWRYRMRPVRHGMYTVIE